MIISHYASPIGMMTLAAEGECLVGVWFDGQKYFPTLPSLVSEVGASVEEDKVLGETRRWLDLYFQGKEPDFTPRLKITRLKAKGERLKDLPDGSEFKKMVADVMLSIPYGKTMTYGEIAKEVARRMGRERMSAQAVGGAVGHNCISLIIPCHRVLGSDGSLTGYAGGIERKQWLLKHELTS